MREEKERVVANRRSRAEKVEKKKRGALSEGMGVLRL